MARLFGKFIGFFTSSTSWGGSLDVSLTVSRSGWSHVHTGTCTH